MLPINLTTCVNFTTLPTILSITFVIIFETYIFE